MDAPRKLALGGLGLVAVAAAGCVSPYPYYSPYGHGAQPGPGYYGQPQSFGPSSAVPGGVQMNAPTPVESGPSGDSETDAPPFGGGSQDVPNYRTPDPGDLNAPPSNTDREMFYDEEKTSFGTDKTPFGMRSGRSEPKVLAFDESEPARGSVSTAAAETEAEAPPPIQLAAGEYSTPLELKTDSASLKLPYDPDSMPNPYNHDREGYRSLQGLVSFDEQSQTWIIMYNDKPEREDEYGGVFTLADDDRLSVLNDYDVVYVEGSVSETETDAFGKPMYQVKFLNKLRPRAK
jgi:hypothetical protein